MLRLHYELQSRLHSLGSAFTWLAGSRLLALLPLPAAGQRCHTLVDRQCFPEPWTVSCQPCDDFAPARIALRVGLCIGIEFCHTFFVASVSHSVHCLCLLACMYTADPHGVASSSSVCIFLNAPADCELALPSCPWATLLLCQWMTL